MLEVYHSLNKFQILHSLGTYPVYLRFFIVRENLSEHFALILAILGLLQQVAILFSPEDVQLSIIKYMVISPNLVNQRRF